MNCSDALLAADSTFCVVAVVRSQFCRWLYATMTIQMVMVWGDYRPAGWVLDLNTNPENHAYGPCFLNEDDRWDRIAKEEGIKEARKEAYNWVYCDDEEDEYYEEGDCSPVVFPLTEEELVEEARWLLDEEMDRRYARKAA
jgi:hypothetical protein